MVIVVSPSLPAAVRSTLAVKRPLPGRTRAPPAPRAVPPDLAPASSATGVPARRAQPGCSGPIATNATVASAIAIPAEPAASLVVASGSSEIRHQSAAATAATQPASSTTSQLSLVSVPVPRPCQSATGQDA